MKIIFVLFLILLLPACSFYTLTNKTGRTLKIETSGGDKTITLEAFSCIQLNEHFMGLGGDFPFIINGNKKREYSANHYEVKVKSSSDTSAVFEYIASESSENPECESSKSQKIQIDDKTIAVCGTAASQSAQCQSSDGAPVTTATVRCMIREDKINEKQPVCVDKDNNLLDNDDVKPGCKSSSEQPVCMEQTQPQTQTQTPTEQFYTITLKADNVSVNIVADIYSQPLKATGDCVKIKNNQFTSLVVSLSSTGTVSYNKTLCNHTCSAGNYEITTVTDAVGGAITDSQLTRASEINPNTNCVELK